MQTIKWNRVLMALGGVALLLSLSFILLALWLLDKRDTEIKRRMSAPAREGLANKRAALAAAQAAVREAEASEAEEKQAMNLPLNGSAEHVEQSN